MNSIDETDDIPEGISPEVVREEIKNSLKDYLRRYFDINEIAEAKSKGQDSTIKIDPPEEDQAWINTFLLYDYFLGENFLEDTGTLPKLFIKAFERRDNETFGDPVESKRSFEDLDSLIDHFFEPIGNYLNEEIKKFYTQNLPDLDKIFKKRIDEILQEIRLEIEAEIQTRRAEQQTLFPTSTYPTTREANPSTTLSIDPNLVNPGRALKRLGQKELKYTIAHDDTGKPITVEDIIKSNHEELSKLSSKEYNTLNALILFLKVTYDVNAEEKETFTFNGKEYTRSQITKDIQSKGITYDNQTETITFYTPLDNNFLSYLTDPVKRKDGSEYYRTEDRENIKTALFNLIKHLPNIKYIDSDFVNKNEFHFLNLNTPFLQYAISANPDPETKKHLIRIKIKEKVLRIPVMDYMKLKPTAVKECSVKWRELKHDPEYEKNPKENPYHKYINLADFADIPYKLHLIILDLYTRENEKINQTGRGKYINNAKKYKVRYFIDRLKYEERLKEKLRVKKETPRFKELSKYILEKAFDINTGKGQPLKKWLTNEKNKKYLHLSFDSYYFDRERARKTFYDELYNKK